jgi:bacillithiol synthase
MNIPMESHCLSFREIPHTPKLLTSFLEDFSSVSSYYAHPPTIDGIIAAARQLQLDPAVRKSAVAILREQNRTFGRGNEIDAATSRNLDRLAAGAVAIVTGQQVGLFSGPAYTFYKALSAVRCAEEITRRGADAIPIFWLATEDHDLAEINVSHWNTRNGLTAYSLPDNPQDAGRRVGEISLGDEIKPLVAAAAQTLEGSFADDVGRALRESYAPGETYGSAFGKLMARLLAGRGIIFVDPLDARLHRLFAPALARAIREADPLREALLERSKELESAGFHSQVKVTRESTLLFSSVGGPREPIRSRDGGFIVGDTEISAADLIAAIEKSPEAFSPNALFRPIIQDTFLPTAAYIGGPAEIAYMAQAQVIYQGILGRMPAILPRASFTIVEPPIARFLSQYELDLRDFLAGPQHVRAKMEQKSIPEDLAKSLDDGEQKIRNILKTYEEPLTKLDATLVEALRAVENKMLYMFAQLRAKTGRAENFRSGVIDRHQRILTDALHPDGDLPERSLCFLPLLASGNPDLLDNLAKRCSLADSVASGCVNQHQILSL